MRLSSHVDLHPWRGPELPFQTLLFSLFPLIISDLTQPLQILLLGEGMAPYPLSAHPAGAHRSPMQS